MTIATPARILMASVVLLCGLAAAPPTASPTIGVDSSIAVATQFTATADGRADITLQPVPDGEVSTVHYLVYDGDSGQLVEAGSAYDELSGFTHRWVIDGDIVAGRSYTVVLTGSGRATFDNAIDVRQRALAAGEALGERVFVTSLDYRFNPVRGGYAFTNDYFEFEQEELVGLAMLATRREADLSINRSTGHLCFDGRNVTCDDDRVEVDDLGVTPVTEELSVSAGSFVIGPDTAGDRDLTAEVYVYQPLRNDTDQVAELSIVPRYLHLG